MKCRRLSLQARVMPKVDNCQGKDGTEELMHIPFMDDISSKPRIRDTAITMLHDLRLTTNGFRNACVRSGQE